MELIPLLSFFDIVIFPQIKRGAHGSFDRYCVLAFGIILSVAAAIFLVCVLDLYPEDYRSVFEGIYLFSLAFGVVILGIFWDISWNSTYLVLGGLFVGYGSALNPKNLS